jgi:hypothetical protein
VFAPSAGLTPSLDALLSSCVNIVAIFGKSEGTEALIRPVRAAGVTAVP